MTQDPQPILSFLEGVHPYDSLPRAELERVAASFRRLELAAGQDVYRFAAPLEGLYLILRGGVDVSDSNGAVVSILGPRNSFGERGLMRDGRAATSARAREDSVLLLLPKGEFTRLMDSAPFARFFNRARARDDRREADLAVMKVAELLARAPVSCRPVDTVQAAARIMRDQRVSSLGVIDPEQRLLGIVTQRDLADKVVAGNLPGSTPISHVMTPDPVSLPRQALGADVLHVMLEREIRHLPICDAGRFVGMITQTDLTRFQAVTSALLMRDMARAQDVAQMAEVTGRIPQLLVQLVGGHQSHEVVTRLITDIADALTRRLLALAEAELGAPPCPWVWLACGSQGRQEQTGLSDQDNCLILDDACRPQDIEYFQRFAKFVCDGLNACGYVYCPGDMMATNPRWCQPARVWAGYFDGWIDTPNPEAQMLASVMFDLRVIGGPAPGLFYALQARTLERASANSIFTAHMIANSLKHHPPLGLLRGFATIRSGEHRNEIDLKHNGVVPVADLARIYALRGRIGEANTRARLEAAARAGLISASGARDLIEAYDLIATTRLESQAARIRAGARPSNYLAPSDLSDFERAHLRDAFVVVRSMQSAIGHGKASVS